jgi:ComF family protein
MLYDGAVKALIHRFKYDNKVQSRRPLGLLAAKQLMPFVTGVEPDVLVPVPLHRKRLRHRCFNQAVLLSEILGREWRLPILRTNLRRIRWTEPQINLSAEERVRNVRGAFSVTNPGDLAGKRVVLVDDVYTTGSTVGECARVLIAAGTEAVYVVTVARALV